LAGGGRASSGTTRVLAPVSAANVAVADAATVQVASAAPVATTTPAPQVAKTVAAIADRPRSRRHTVRDGESAWTIARRYGMPVKALLSLNGLSG
ncbi:LysM peptidoglycan-binding domain-containing protein, partial [bacterium M00.F.Ca.ET.221.01.1.1]